MVVLFCFVWVSVDRLCVKLKLGNFFPFVCLFVCCCCCCGFCYYCYLQLVADMFWLRHAVLVHFEFVNDFPLIPPWIGYPSCKINYFSECKLKHFIAFMYWCQSKCNLEKIESRCNSSSNSYINNNNNGSSSAATALTTT